MKFKGIKSITITYNDGEQETITQITHGLEIHDYILRGQYVTHLDGSQDFYKLIHELTFQFETVGPLKLTEDAYNVSHRK